MNPELKEFREQGYILKKKLFGADEVTNIKIQAMHLFKQQFVAVGLAAASETETMSEDDFNLMFFDFFQKHADLVISTGKHVQHLVSLHRLALDARITDYIQTLGVEFPNVCTRPVLFFNAKKLAKKQVYWKMSPHQDWRSMQGSLNAMVVWLPLVDVNIELGTLEIVPKSHVMGLNTTGFEDGFGLIADEIVAQHDWIPVEVEAGDALFFSAFLYHRSGNNSTENGIRWSCHFRYNDMNEPTFVERGYPHPYMYYPDPKELTPNFPKVKLLENYFGK
jgi:hypothetical protein